MTTALTVCVNPGIWGAVVIIMSFANMANAVSLLSDYSRGALSVIPKGGTGVTPTPASTAYYGPGVRPLNWDIFGNHFLPAFVLLVIAVVGIYLLLAERSRVITESEM